MSLTELPAKTESPGKAEPFRVLLVRPPGEFTSPISPDGPRVGPPLGLLFLVGALAGEEGVETQVLDALAEPDLEQLASSRPPLWFGLRPEEIAERARAYRPHLVGIAANASFFFPVITQVVRALRQALPDAFLVVGGPDASLRPGDYLRERPGLDAAVRGEGERVLQELTRRLRAGDDWRDLPGVSYLEGDELVDNPFGPIVMELDAFEPDFDAVDLERYFRLNAAGFESRETFRYPGSERAVDLVTSRSCPFPCTFCTIHVSMRRPYRAHSPEWVLRVLEKLARRGVRHVHFEDDNLTHHRERFAAILRGLIERDLGLTWDTPNGVRADDMDAELLALMKRSGCVSVIFGVESGNQEVLDTIVRKHLTLAQVEEATRLCQEAGLDHMAFYIFGLPGETREQLQQTYELAFDLHRRHDTVPVAMLARPYASTEMHALAKRAGSLVDTDPLAAQAEHGVPHVLFANEMIDSEQLPLAEVTRVYWRYGYWLLLVAAWNWLKIVSRHSPVLRECLVDFARRLVKHPLQIKRVVIEFFFGSVIYPRACIRFADVRKGRRAKPRATP